jgi:hypothetical protein
LAGDFLAVRPDVRLRFVAFLRPDDAAAARPVLAEVFRPTVFFALVFAPLFFAALLVVERVPAREVVRDVVLDGAFVVERALERDAVRFVRAADFAADFVPFRAVDRAGVRVAFDAVRALVLVPRRAAVPVFDAVRPLVLVPRRAAVPVFVAARPRVAVPLEAVLRVLLAAVARVLFFAADRVVLFFAAVRPALFAAVRLPALFAAVRLPRAVVPDFAAPLRVDVRPVEPDARRVAPDLALDARPLAVLLAPAARRVVPVFAEAARRVAPRFVALAAVLRDVGDVAALLRARVAPLLREPVLAARRGAADSVDSPDASSASLVPLLSLASSSSTDARSTNLKKRLVLSPIVSWCRKARLLSSKIWKNSSQDVSSSASSSSPKSKRRMPPGPSPVLMTDGRPPRSSAQRRISS